MDPIATTDQLQPLIETRQYEKVVDYCENVELELAINGNTTNMTNGYALLMAGYTLCNDLDSARFLRKRILACNGGTPELDTLWDVCAALLDRRFQDVYGAINMVKSCPGWEAWLRPILQSMMEALEVTVRAQILGLVAKAYECIKIADAVKYFGMSEDILLQELTSEGWNYNPSTHTLVSPMPEPATRNPTDLTQFERLTDIVVQLEKF